MCLAFLKVRYMYIYLNNPEVSTIITPILLIRKWQHNVTQLVRRQGFKSRQSGSRVQALNF